MSAVDREEILRLGGIMQEFNEEAQPRIGSDAAVQRRLQGAMTREDGARIAALAQDMMQALMVATMSSDEDSQAEYVSRTIAFVNEMLGLAQRAGVEDAFAEAFPAEHKTAENARVFEKVGAPHIAKLCRP